MNRAVRYGCGSACIVVIGLVVSAAYVAYKPHLIDDLDGCTAKVVSGVGGKILLVDGPYVKAAGRVSTPRVVIDEAKREIRIEHYEMYLVPFSSEGVTGNLPVGVRFEDLTPGKYAVKCLTSNGYQEIATIHVDPSTDEKKR